MWNVPPGDTVDIRWSGRASLALTANVEGGYKNSLINSDRDSVV